MESALWGAREPMHFMGSPKRSCQIRPSGLSITSQVSGSSNASLTSVPAYERNAFSKWERVVSDFVDSMKEVL